MKRALRKDAKRKPRTGSFEGGDYRESGFQSALRLLRRFLRRLKDLFGRR